MNRPEPLPPSGPGCSSGEDAHPAGFLFVVAVLFYIVYSLMAFAHGVDKAEWRECKEESRTRADYLAPAFFLGCYMGKPIHPREE